MSASTTFTPDPVPVARSSDQISVYRYFDGADEFSDKYELLSWILCLGVSRPEGADPGSARFRYKNFDPGDPDGQDVPRRIEDGFPLNATGPKVINNDDRLVVRRTTDDGSSDYMFDGFVLAPQGDLGAETEQVSFIAVGTPKRESDTPLAGAVMRDADVPLTVSDKQTDIPARFNPDGYPNASPSDESGEDPVGDSGVGDAKYPIFCGPYPPKNKINGQVLRMWTLAMAARYIIVRGCDDGNGNPSKYVTYDDLSYLDTLLTAWTPTGGGTDDGGDPVGDALDALAEVIADPDSTQEEIDAAQDAYDQAWADADAEAIDEDNASFATEDIEAPDLIISGMAWPSALQRLIEPYGFSIRFDLEEAEPPDDEDGNPGEFADGEFGDPEWTLKVYWKESDRPAKTVSLQPAGQSLDPAKTSVLTMSLVRDSASIANRVAIDAAVARVEVPLVLVPGYTVDTADATAPNPDNFKLVNLTSETRDTYRKLVFDECGEGHWDFKTAATVNTPGDLAPAFADLSTAKGVDRSKRYWSIRRRKPEDRLVSVDDAGKPLTATLFVSFDYAGAMPGVWDGTGTWQEVVSGSWRLLDDQLGVYLTADDINSWAVSPLVDADGPFTPLSQLNKACINVVEWTAAPSDANPYPRFMLLCCVDTDNDFDVVAPKRASSATSFAVTRRVDARDRFKKTVINKWSFFADLENDFGKNDRVVTDDQADAQALADAERRHSESAVFAGSVTIPRISLAYSNGDKITTINGRNMSLRSNVGAEQGESPVYPTVVGISWNLDGAQSTELTLSDERAEPPPRRGRRRDE